jgi:hypothetical protein
MTDHIISATFNIKVSSRVVNECISISFGCDGYKFHVKHNEPVKIKNVSVSFSDIVNKDNKNG